MAKKKSSPALFELIHRGKGKDNLQMMVPPWMSKGGPLDEARDKQTVESPPAAQEQPLVPPPVREVPPPAARAETPPPPPERIVATEGKRLKVSITNAQAIAGGAAMLILVAGVFLLGKAARRSSSAAPAVAQAAKDRYPRAPLDAGRAPQREAPTARQSSPQAAKPAATESPARTAEIKQPTPPAAPARAAEAVREKGKYYLVIQGLMGLENAHRVEAEAIAEFLNSSGEPVTVNEFKGPPRQYIVLSLRGFDAPDSPEAKRYLQAVEEQGKLYRKQGGKYDFRQGDKGWFVPWTR